MKFQIQYKILLFICKIYLTLVFLVSNEKVIIIPIRKKNEHKVSLFFNDFEDYISTYKKTHKENYRVMRYRSAKNFIDEVIEKLIPDDPNTMFLREISKIMNIGLEVEEIYKKLSTDVSFEVELKRNIFVIFVNTEKIDEFLKNQHYFDFDPSNKHYNKSGEFWWSSIYEEYQHNG